MQLMEHKKGNEATNKTVFVEESTVDRMSTAAVAILQDTGVLRVELTGFTTCARTHTHTQTDSHTHKHTY